MVREELVVLQVTRLDDCQCSRTLLIAFRAVEIWKELTKRVVKDVRILLYSRMRRWPSLDADEML